MQNYLPVVSILKFSNSQKIYKLTFLHEGKLALNIDIVARNIALDRYIDKIDLRHNFARYMREILKQESQRKCNR